MCADRGIVVRGFFAMIWMLKRMGMGWDGMGPRPRALPIKISTLPC